MDDALKLIFVTSFIGAAKSSYVHPSILNVLSEKHIYISNSNNTSRSSIIFYL